MAFDRDRLVNPITYYESQDLRLTGPGTWKTTACRVHGGRDSMRINVKSGAFCCMNCGVKGGDILAYEMQANGTEFVEAAKALGAWVDDGKPVKPQKAAPLPPRAALQVIAFECTLTAIAAANVARGVALSDVDRARILAAANRIARLSEAYQ